MARIPQSFIDELLGRTDIVAVIEARLALKKAGHEFQACCPFHDEKTPSFTVSPTKQFYHCFGCGAHGSAINFLMTYDRLEFRDAVEQLASRAGMDIPAQAKAGAPTDSNKPLYAALARADRYYRSSLRSSPIAINYLKQRGLTGQLAKLYGVGFAPPGWDNILQGATDRKAAKAAGLLIENSDKGRIYDRFRNRIMFPIRDGRGRTIAFGGRTLGDDKAKYLNSPETPLFHKGRQLYGLYEARQQRADTSRILVVEGYMDVLALAQHGFPNTVATLGTATTPEHLQKLFRLTEEVVFCFDGDAAGQRAGWRALERALALMHGTRRVRFLFLPAGEDPDSLVRGSDGPTRFQQLIDTSLPASQVLLDGLQRDVDMHTPDGRSRLAEKARPYISQLPHEAFRLQLTQQIAQRCGLPTADLQKLYEHKPDATSHGAATPAGQSRTRHNTGKRITPIRRAMQLLMNNPRLADNIQQTDTLRTATTAGAPLLADAIDFFRNNPTYTVAALLERWRERSEFEALHRLAASTPRGDAQALAREFSECLAHLERNQVQQAQRARYHALLAQQQRGPLSDAERAELQHVLQQIRARQKPD